jgi:putative DNA primase/helicase
MSESAALPKPDWLGKVEEIVGRYAEAGADADACETVCNKIAQWHGADAVAKARELFAAQRSREAAAKAPPPAPPAPKVVVEVKPQPKPERVASAALVLNPSSPYDTAGEFIHRRCMLGDQCILWFWQDQFYRWGGRVYEPVSEKALEGQLYEFLDKAVKSSGGGHVRFQPTPKNVSDVLHGIKSRLSLGTEYHPPMWISTREPAADWVVFNNKVVNVQTEDEMPLTPDLWVHSALEFDWNPEATCEAWETFLAQVFPGDGPSGEDVESINLLEEWMGYCMTEETKFQKGLLMIGQRRSGKGTISRVLQQLVGNRSYVGLSFNTWIYSENSKEVLIGKRVGVFADVRFKPGKSYGQNYDPGGITHQSAEFLLNVTGEDTVTIGRKYKAPWQGQLKLKMMLISNEPPNLNDSSGVLPSRFVKLHFPVSFYNREDVDLQWKLRAELSGIAVRCVRAYTALCERTHFVQPQSANALEKAVLVESDPFAAMVAACFVADFEGTAVRTAMVDAAQSWLRGIGRPDEAVRIRVNNIVARVRGIAGFGHIGDAPRPHGQPRSVSGLRLRPKSERE